MRRDVNRGSAPSFRAGLVTIVILKVSAVLGITIESPQARSSNMLEQRFSNIHDSIWHDISEPRNDYNPINASHFDTGRRSECHVAQAAQLPRTTSHQAAPAYPLRQE